VAETAERFLMYYLPVLYNEKNRQMRGGKSGGKNIRKSAL